MSIAELGPLGFDGGQGVFNGVPEGATLTIEPGVKIYLHENATFAVNGVLNAVGAPDNMITFTHANCFEHWGNLYFTGEQASESTLEYVRIQYSDDGVKGENAFPHRIANSIIRKVGIYGLKIALREGDHQGIEVVGNTISQGAGVGISIDLGPGATIPQITVRENELSNFYNAGVIIGADEDLTTTPQVVVEHNVFENGFRGIGGGFSAVGNVKYRHNYNSNSVSGSGVQVFWPDNEIMHNFFENTFESAYQLHSARLTDIHGRANTVFSYNTIKKAPIESNLGDPDTVVENNNFYPDPDSVFWAWGLDKQSGLVADMSNNWWGTASVEEIRRHIIDGKRSPKYADSYMELLIEPVLTGPNGFGFVRGKVVDSDTGLPLSRALMKGEGFEVRTNVVGGLFASMLEGVNTLTVELEGYGTGEFAVEIVAAEVSSAELLMKHPDEGS